MRVAAVDVRLAAYLHTHATPLLTVVMIFISYFGSLTVTGGIAFLSGIISWRRQESDRLLALVVTVPGGMIINVLVNTLFTDPVRISIIPSLSSPLIAFRAATRWLQTQKARDCSRAFCSVRRRLCINYLRRRLRFQAAKPSKPAPKRNMEPGSGVVTESLSRIRIPPGVKACSHARTRATTGRTDVISGADKNDTACLRCERIGRQSVGSAPLVSVHASV